MTSRPDPLRPPENYGARPPEQAVKFTDPTFIFSGLCDYGTPRWLDHPAVSLANVCKERSVCVVWVGCRGEHMGQIELCAKHSAALGQRTVFCSQCRQRGHHGNQMVPIKREMV